MNYVRLTVVDAFRLLEAICENPNTSSPNTVMKDPPGITFSVAKQNSYCIGGCKFCLGNNDVSATIISYM